MYKKSKKIIALILVFILMMANVSTIGVHMGEVLAADSTLEKQNSNTNVSNVEFDAYFLDGENKTYEATKNIGEDNKIIVELTVKNAGYLKNAMVQFSDSNFVISDNVESEYVSNVQANSIEFKQINSGEKVKLEIPIELIKEDSIKASQFSLINSINMTGTYVDNNGTQHKVEKEIMLGLNWTSNAELTLESEVTKFVPYDINDEKGLILQTTIKSGIKDNVLPIKNTNIQVNVPSINGISPKDIKVNANNTVATNGQESGINFNENNYNIEENIITINVENNLDENQKIFWKKQATDEYVISFIYPEEVLTTISEQTDVELKVNSKIKLYDADQRVLEGKYENIYKEEGQVGNIIDFLVTANETLSKGQIYANYDASKKIDVEYSEKIIANIGLADLADKIVINQNADKFITESNKTALTTISGNNYAYYKNITISQERFSKILGNEGYIKIYSGSTLVNTIDSNTKANENGNIVVDLSELNINSITIQTSKPLVEGNLEIDITKAIKGDIAYSKAQVETFKNLELEIEAQSSLQDTVVVEQIKKANITLVEPETSVELTINNKDLSTIVTNENVEIRAILKTDSINNKLFSNPKIVIELPSYIKEINVKNVQLLFEDELVIEPINITENENGVKVIEISLTGTQTKYSLDAVNKGANIVITADITLDSLTPSMQTQFKMICTNMKEEKEAAADVNYVAPTGIVTVNKITNTSDSQEVMALTEDETIPLEVTTGLKNITAQIQIINNYSNVINNIRILGRTLMTGTTDMETSDDLNNTFDAPMVGAINSEIQNVTIYYSENGNATESLEDLSNGWTTQVEDFSKVKSYLIVLNDYTMNVGDSAKFTYDAQIPENLNYSEEVKSVYTVYFDNVQEKQVLKDRAKSRMLTLATGVAPTLDVKLESTSQENSVVREEQYVKFKAIVTNTGTVDAQNVKLNITAPSAKIYTYTDDQGNILFTEDTSLIADVSKQLIAEYSTKHTEFVQDNFTSEYVDSDNPEKTIEVGTIKVGESTQVEYELKMVNVEVYKQNAYIDGHDNLVLPETILNNTARVIADDMQKEVVSNEYKLKIDEGYIKLAMKSDKYIDYTLIKDDTLKYSVRIENINDEALKNVVVKVQIPEKVEIKELDLQSLVISSDYTLKYTTSIDKEKNIATFNIEELPQNWIINCNVNTQIGDIEGQIEAIATVQADGMDVHYSNPIANNVGKLSFTIKQLAPEKEYIKEREQITYVYEIENTSDIYTNSFKFTNKIPVGMKFINAEVIKEDTSYSRAGQVEDTLELNLNSFKGNSKIKIKVTMQAEELAKGETEKEIVNYATISGDEFETLNSNSVKTVIEYNEEIHKIDYGDGNVPDDSDITQTGYKISGLAWVDANKNGQRDEEEELLPGMEVMLLNKNTNEIVKDITTGSEKITKTSSSGEYLFTNLEKGEYLVIFEYNNAKYDLTEYKKAGVKDTVNSDVINIDMQIDGKLVKVAISDCIRITNSNARNIDIGLCESEKSDLRLDKYISAITVTYGDTVKTYNYEDAKLAKVEIPAKELSNATVIIDYKIVVTNEGAIGNYVRKIVDYIPSDMKFNSELNKDWYQSTNGDLYNSSLANKKLESGETAEVTLTLTKKMTDTNTGIVNNNAEIYEAFNEEGILDQDSTVANKVSSEDDMSAADVVISVKTGDAVIYTALISVIICITIGVSAYYIRKKVLRRM